MRLLLAIPYFAPAYAFGGSVTVAETVVTDALAAGHQVTVATTDVLDEHRSDRARRPAVPPGAEVVRFPNVSHRAAAARQRPPPARLPRAGSRERRSFDAVLLHDVYSAISVHGARGRRPARVPYALQPLGTLSPARERGRPLAKRVFLGAVGAPHGRRAAALVHSCGGRAADFLDVGADPQRLCSCRCRSSCPSSRASR